MLTAGDLAFVTQSGAMVYRLLQGYRDRPRAALREVANCLIRLSQLVIDIAELGEVDINPLLADNTRILALGDELGFERDVDGIVHVRRRLEATA